MPAAVSAATLPPRLAFVVAPTIVACVFVLPTWFSRRAAKKRRQRLVEDLPDMLDLLATGAASGRALESIIGDISAASDTPIARELGAVAAAIEVGVSPGTAWGALRDVLGAEASGFVLAIERSRRHGAPLAERIREHAGALRRQAAVASSDRAARAAPKIQLVVAMVLVPSVLLGVAAAIVANVHRFWPL